MHYSIVDAFTSRPFTGNPAAVVPLAEPLPDALLQSIAAEFNLSETAFPRRLQGNQFELRWFTPALEVSLCGHATLAAAHALWENGDAARAEPIRFRTRHSGDLVCLRLAHGWIQMDFPATPAQPAPLPADAPRCLGVAGPVECVGTTPMNLTLRLPSESQVKNARPDFPALAAWHPIGVTITAPADARASDPAPPAFDFVSRFFAPAAGIAEDPVTGSAHCTLAPYWAAQTGRTTFTARQLSQRGGLLKLELRGSRVHILGQALTTMRGQLTAPPA